MPGAAMPGRIFSEGLPLCQSPSTQMIVRPWAVPGSIFARLENPHEGSRQKERWHKTEVAQ